jgi:undecaprenyl-diphosphatase
MNILHAVFLGLIQGLTEFLPVSSSGHLVIFEEFLHFTRTDLSFEVFLHFGTLFAVLIYFRKDIYALVASLFVKGDAETAARRRVMLYLAISTVITGALGLMFNDLVESMFQSPRFCASMLFVTGAILLASDRMRPRSLPMGRMGWLRAVIIGLGQAIAITPGISRSGTTIATGVFCGLDRADAARYSFLLAIPAILGAGLLDLRHVSSLPSDVVLGYLAGALAAFLSGLAVIGWLIGLVKRGRLVYFTIYCWLFATVALFLLP